jgi:hypothetical protein
MSGEPSFKLCRRKKKTTKEEIYSESIMSYFDIDFFRQKLRQDVASRIIEVD